MTFNVCYYLSVIANPGPELESKPRSCKDLQQPGQGKFTNGEHLIYPVEGCVTPIRVYCYTGHNSAEPKEYITVGKGNYVADWRGTTVFSKVTCSFNSVDLHFSTKQQLKLIIYSCVLCELTFLCI